jgi:hypothetical protein
MKAVLALFVLAVPLLGQTETTRPAACGEQTDVISVDVDKSGHAPISPQPDKALVYVIQEMGEAELSFGYPITRVGMDGKWIGADKKNSYLSFFVTPGEQHLCVSIQSISLYGAVELFHFKAEAGKVYYFRTRISWGRDTNVYLSVNPVDSDEGEYLIRWYPSTKLHVSKGRAKPAGRISSTGDSR